MSGGRLVWNRQVGRSPGLPDDQSATTRRLTRIETPSAFGWNLCGKSPPIDVGIESKRVEKRGRTPIDLPGCAPSSMRVRLPKVRRSLPSATNAPSYVGSTPFQAENQRVLRTPP